MANATAADMRLKQQHVAEFGNGWNEDYGPVAATGVLQNEKVYLGIIPAGIRVQSVRLVTSGAVGTSVDLGYEPDEGTTPTAVGDYFIDGLTSTGALNSLATADPITFDKPVKLVLTVLGGNVAATPSVKAIVNGKVVGVP